LPVLIVPLFYPDFAELPKFLRPHFRITSSLGTIRESAGPLNTRVFAGFNHTDQTSWLPVARELLGFLVSPRTALGELAEPERSKTSEIELRLDPERTVAANSHSKLLSLIAISSAFDGRKFESPQNTFRSHNGLVNRCLSAIKLRTGSNASASQAGVPIELVGILPACPLLGNDRSFKTYLPTNFAPSGG
jgi:hypothetical protein